MNPSDFGKAVSREAAKAKKTVAAKSIQSTGTITDKPGNRRGRVENLKPWKPGQSGNPGGRLKKLPITDTIREALAKDMGAGKTAADIIVEVLLAAAKKGDITAIREIADRAEGKPVQVSQLQGPGGGPIPIDHLTQEEKHKRIAELMAKANGTNGADGD
jgi:hypothetical protein